MENIKNQTENENLDNQIGENRNNLENNIENPNLANENMEALSQTQTGEENVGADFANIDKIYAQKLKLNGIDVASIKAEDIQIVEVKSKKQQKQFVDFPTKLYDKNPWYVHPLRVDELNLFNKDKNASYDDCDAVYYLAMVGGKVVGRIAGIIQRLYNQKTGEKRARFTRFDSVNNVFVAKALFNAVEVWAKNKGMEKVHGPLGFNDLDREGLLIAGFDQLSTFEEQYNYSYYPSLIENAGYGKEIDWVEFRLFPPKETNERVTRLSEAVLKRYKLKIATAKNKRQYIKKYKKEIFETIDDAYSNLYGTVPFNDKMRDQIISQFKLFINMDFIISLLDENNRVVAFGFAIPSISNAVQKSKGRLTPLGIIRLLRQVKNVHIADLGLVAVREEYQSKGLTAIILQHLFEVIKKHKLEYCETNLNLENNLRIQQTWKNIDHVQHKRRRCYIKNL